MLINFTLENWRSFRKPATFSMVASREKQHGERLTRVERYKLRLLPVAAIYGGNASGKTNFFAALNFARNLIVRGTRPDELIPVETLSSYQPATHIQTFLAVTARALITIPAP